jgi:hypothetical protein
MIPNHPKPTMPHVLNLSDKVRILDLSKGSMSLVEVQRLYGKSLIKHLEFSAGVMHPQYSWLFLLLVFLEPYSHRCQGPTVKTTMEDPKSKITRRK